MHVREVRTYINKPFQHGFSVRELSKFKLYSFYLHLKDHFQEQVRMLYTDTDLFFL